MSQFGGNGIKTFSVNKSYPFGYQPPYKGGADKAFSPHIPTIFLF
jgi:hypothetical protein